MTDIIVAIVIVAAVAGAIAFIVREKKRGVKCVGCPLAGECGKKTEGCGCDDEK